MVPAHRNADNPHAIITVRQNVISSILTTGIPGPPKHLDRQIVRAGVPDPSQPEEAPEVK